MIKKSALYIFLFFSLLGKAQDSSPQMADDLRSNGKIFVVIAVMAVIFICVAVFLVIIDRKVKKLEDRIKKEN